MDINTLEEEAALSPEEIQRRVERVKNILLRAGAHYVVDTLSQLPPVIEDINARLARGERP